MNIEIINTSLHLIICGFSGTYVNNDYVGKALQLMDKMWQVVKDNKLQNKGLNVWVYEPGDKIFTGVELIDTPGQGVELERKTIHLPRYAYSKHIGSYNLIKKSYQHLVAELQQKGFTVTGPYIEIYGHWTDDESKLETELLMGLQ